MNSRSALVRTRLCVALLASVAVPMALQAQSITNPSFEADSFAIAPGTISANAPITGWSAADNTKAGLNPAGGASAYANNGTIPNGTNVAFIQSTNYLSTVMSGLSAGTDYTVRFRVNSLAGGTAPTLRVAIDNNPSLFDAGAVAPSGAAGVAGPYRHVGFTFKATASSHTLYVSNNAAAANSYLLVDDFRINVSTSGWSYAMWTNDASSGVDSTKRYTHAYAFNTTGASFPINGVTFTRLGGGNPTVPYEFASTMGSGTTDGANVIRTAGGGSATLASQFSFNGNPAVFAFHNLVPGREYVATWYTVGWDAAGKTYGRSVTFAAGDDVLSVNQDHFGDNVGTRISYRYVAPSTGFMLFSNIPFSTAVGTLHTYGASNYEVGSSNEPVIGVQPVPKVSLPGSGAGFYVTVGGARPFGYQWLKDGAPISNQTNRWLILTNLTAADLAQYSIVVSNGFGMVTSSSAGLTFSTDTFANPSFEGMDYMLFPGYVNNNFPIAGWFVSDINRAGIALVGGGSPFANNGTPPSGRDVGFLQNAGGSTSNTLGTLIQGLTPGEAYSLNFAVNARAGQVPNLHISVDGKSVTDIRASSVGGAGFGATGLSAPFRRVAVPFTPTNSTALLMLTNDVGGDTTILLDDFSVSTSTTKWSYAAWTNDASSGVDSSKFYTHAFNFGAVATDTTINGVTFKGIAGVNPSTPQFSTAGFGQVFPGPDANALTVDGGASSAMAQQFLYGGPVQTITLRGLHPGTEYIFTAYAVGFDPRAYGRSATFRVGDDRRTINQDEFGNDIGIRISYQYVADTNGTITFTFEPTDAASTIHTYGFANYQLVGTEPVISVQPFSTFVALGDTATLSVALAAGSQPTYYQWQSGGVDLLDQTNSTLVLSNLNAYGITDYQVIISNALGAVTSVVARVEVGTKLAEVFNSGVDETGYFLTGGAIDPHYWLQSSDDPFYPGPQAFVLYTNVFPMTSYFSNGLFSAWISPRTNSTAGNSNGLYVYRTSFIIDTADPAHAQLSGRWASDNEGVAILLNGVPTGISNMVSVAFSTWHPFVITNGFVAGSNVVDFVVSNGPASGPTALRAELYGVGRPLAPTAPQILSEPTDQTVLEHATVTFAVEVVGSGPLSYQWFYEGFPIEFGTNRTLRLNDVALDQSGNYSVSIVNNEGSTNSASAFLDVILPPIVITPPESTSAPCGGEALFGFEYDGTPPLTFQWYFGNTPILDQTNDLLVVTNVNYSVAGLYRVVLNGPGGSATSAVATLTVDDTTAPTIVGGTNMVVYTSSNSFPATFVVTATDDCATNATLVCVPASGSQFPLGTNTVVCTAYDPNFNTNTHTFTVTVVAVTRPTAANINRTGDTVTFGFQTQNGVVYRVQYTDSFTPAVWTNLTTITGDGNVATITDTNATGPMRFYRIIVE